MFPENCSHIVRCISIEESYLVNYRREAYYLLVCLKKPHLLVLDLPPRSSSFATSFVMMNSAHIGSKHIFLELGFLTFILRAKPHSLFNTYEKQFCSFLFSHSFVFSFFFFEPCCNESLRHQQQYDDHFRFVV